MKIKISISVFPVVFNTRVISTSLSFSAA